MPTGPTVIIGAGPAGLTAAYLLAKRGLPVTVLEADPEYVGGISKTVHYRGYSFDIGGHRFFSKSKEVEDLWTEILPDDMLVRPRSSRILYRGKFFSYPLRASQALLNLGIFETFLCVLSYAYSRVFPVTNPRTFEEWVSNQFGTRLFRIFFKTYTEKVWGTPCSEISADWAAQRIKGLSLSKAIINALFPQRQPKARNQVVKTLIESFRYPRRGPGMMWEKCAERITQLGGRVLMGQRVTGCSYDAQTALWTITTRDAQGREDQHVASHAVSSAPIRELAGMLDPSLQPAASEAAGQLKYRDFLTVALIVKERHVFDDNWIYIHDPHVKVGRIQNFKSWSPEMVPDPATTCYGLEYFCFEGDGLWNSTDAELIALAQKEIVQLGLSNADDLLDACVVRQRKAYPVYDDAYAAHVDTVRRELETRFPTLHLIGRNGMHKYNNQDHSMMTAMLCAENIAAGRRVYNLWEVNEDAEYHESGEHSASGLRQVPQKAATA